MTDLNLETAEVELLGQNYYFLTDDKRAEPCDMIKWSKQFEEMSINDTKHVGETEINDCLVSTVWLGLNHNYFGGEPLIFETMVFKGDTSNDIYCARYSTWNEAELGHQVAVQWVKDGCKDDE